MTLQIMTLKYQKLREYILLFLIIIDLRVTYFIQRKKELVDKSSISNLVKFFDLSTKPATLTAKAELKAKQDKL